MKPLIGITADILVSKDKPHFLARYGQAFSYSDAVILAGGIPVIIPISKTGDDASEVLARLDGILFAGGNDISPSLYGQGTRDAPDVDNTRDEHEVRLMNLALELHMPMLLVCRGMQMFNALRGGTLYQDIVKEIPEAINHNGFKRDPGADQLLHMLTIEPESELAKILGTTTIQSNTFHHQAIKDVGAGLVVTATTEDGIIEAIEDMSQGYLIGVQAHPESLVQQVELGWRPLFESFIAAASKTYLYSGLEKSNLLPASQALR